MTDFYQIDESLRAEANELLWGKGLHALLAQHGQVQLVPSILPV